LSFTPYNETTMSSQNQRKNAPLNGPSADEEDERFMRMALREAARGVGRTSPNPAVGAVIAKRGCILARGFHHAAGGPHAEIEALRALKRPAQAHGATIYVTLEPCSTHGCTPPCTDAILRAGLARVVIGAVDPNPRHAGRGRGLLENAGLTVREGVLAEECRKLNAGFNKWIVSGIPWVIAKAALTLDGRLTRPPGEGQWLSGPAARAHAHRTRARVDAILIGAGTLRADNPRLTVRGVMGNVRQPWRIVLTRNGNLPPDAHLFTDEWKERTLVFRRRSLRSVLEELGRRQITSVLIEGGGQVLGQAFAGELVDEVQFYLTPLIAGGPDAVTGKRPALLPAIVSPHYERLGPDALISGLMPDRH
jgi:diaminohydroxyphosphoribosylaminopyrimidine deaminase/5-amino-6-(5-phosphoribosylamino)uracil reductase